MNIARSESLYTCRAVLIALLVVVGVTTLPHDLVVRYSALTGDAKRVQWVYRRVNVDQAPVDVAFIGTSHAMQAVDDASIESALRNSGRPLNVANLAVPYHGRDLHHFVFQELLEARNPKLVVLEVRHAEGRDGHPVFAEIADVGQVLGSSLRIYLRALQDLARLPNRQLSLFMRNFLQPDVEDTLQRPNENLHSYRADIRPLAGDGAEAGMKRGRAFNARVNASAWRKSLEPLEYRYARNIVREMCEKAQASGTEMTFLYLPFYSAPAKPHDLKFYRQCGEVWFMHPEVIASTNKWRDKNHLNDDGSALMAPWLAERISNRVAEVRADATRRPSGPFVLPVRP